MAFSTNPEFIAKIKALGINPQDLPDMIDQYAGEPGLPRIPDRVWTLAAVLLALGTACSPAQPAIISTSTSPRPREDTTPVPPTIVVETPTFDPSAPPIFMPDVGGDPGDVATEAAATQAAVSTIETGEAQRDEFGFVTRGGGLLKLRVRQDDLSPFQFQTLDFEYAPTIDGAQMDSDLGKLTLQAFANALGYDINVPFEQLEAQMRADQQSGKIFSLRLAQAEADGSFRTLKVPQGGFPERSVDPFKGLLITLKPTDNDPTIPYPGALAIGNQGKLGKMGVIFGATEDGQLVAEVACDRNLFQNANSDEDGQAINALFIQTLGRLGWRQTTFTRDPNNPPMPADREQQFTEKAQALGFFTTASPFFDMQFPFSN